MRTLLLSLVLALAPCIALPQAADAASDAPHERFATGHYPAASNYPEALARWKGADDINAWIGARFQYDRTRALQLSETQRDGNGRMPIHEPQDFFATPAGICVDLARFGVETLRSLEPAARPRYLMIEFDPVTIQGNTLRRHWVTMYERHGALYFFADSKRPGHVAGPYASTSAYIADYARYRGRAIVAWREMDSYARTMRTRAVRQERAAP